LPYGFFYPCTWLTFYLMPARPARVVLLLDPEQAPDGFLDSGSRDLPRLDGVHHGIVSVGLLLRTGDYEQISPRLERCLGLPSVTVPPVHR
jgi:hypothetical protein